MTVHAVSRGIQDVSAVGLKGKLFKAMALSGAAGFMNRFLLFVGTAFLARMLGPSTMGVGSLGGLILAAVVLTCNRGVPQSVVRMRDKDADVVADTGFYLMLAIGVVGTLAFALLSPVFAWAFGQPRLGEILPVLSLGVAAFAVGRIHTSV